MARNHVVGQRGGLSGSAITRTIEVTNGTRESGSSATRASTSIRAMATPAPIDR
jgi:hypothetical protein